MRSNRIFQKIALTENAEIELDENASNHVTRVLRLHTKDPLIIFNGEGGEYEAVVVEPDKRKTKVKLISFINKNLDSPLAIHLGQVVSRGEKMEFTIQKAIELGVREITPLISERCEVKLSQERWDKKCEHWQKIIESACEQSGVNKLPQLNKPVDITRWFDTCHAEKKIVLHPHEQTKFGLSSPVNQVAIAVGPEGGLSDREITLAKNAGFDIMQLGPRILRTETAALAAIAVLQNQAGDFN